MYVYCFILFFLKVILRFFVVVSLIFLVYFSYLMFVEYDLLKERLYKLGYLIEGFIFSNNIIWWVDGYFMIVQGVYVEDYLVIVEQVYEIVWQYLVSYNKKLEKYNYKFYLDKKSFIEKEKDGQKYWVFELKFDIGGFKFFVGFIWVNWKMGVVLVKGFLG